MQLLLLIPLFLAPQASSEGSAAPVVEAVPVAAQDGLRAYQQILRLESTAKADQQALSAIESDLADVLERIAAELPPEPPKLAELTYEEMASSEKGVESSQAFLEAWRDRESYRARARGLVEAGDALTDGLLEDHTDLMERVVALRPMLIDLQRRIESGEVLESALGVSTGGVADLLERTAELLPKREELIAAVAKLLSDYEQRRAAFLELPDPDPALQRRSERIALALGTIIEAQAAEIELARRLEASPVETLPAELERIWQEWLARHSAMASATDAYSQAAEAFTELTEEREARRVPRAGDVPEGEELLEVRKARRDVEFSTQLIDYYERDIELLDRLSAAREAVVATVAECTRRHAALSRQTARSFTAIKLLKAKVADGSLEGWNQPEEISAKIAWEGWRTMQIAEADRSMWAADIPEESALEELRRTHTKRLESERETLRRAEIRLSSELSHAEFVATMGSRSNAELLELLAPGAGIEAELGRIDAELAGVNEQLAESEATCIDVSQDVRAVESPYTRRLLNSRIERSTQLTGQLQALVEGQVLPDNSLEVGVKPDELPHTNDEYDLTQAPVTDPLLTAEWEQDRLTAQQVFLRILLSYYLRLSLAHERLIAATDQRVLLGEQREALTEHRLQQLKMRYAAANELRVRVSRGGIEAAELPEQLLIWSSSAAVVEATDEFRSWRSKNREFLERAEYLHERLEVIGSFQSVVQSLSDSADLRAHLIGTPVSRMASAVTPVKELDDVVTMNLQFDARVLEAEERSMLDSAMKRFSSSEVLARFEEPLSTYYLEHANAERVIAELGAAEEAYGHIAQLWREDRERLLPAREGAEVISAQRLFDYHATRYAVSVARFPGAKERVEQAFRESFGRDLPYRLDIDITSTRDAVDALFASEMRLAAQDALTQALERLLSKAGIELEVSWYGEQVSRVRSMLVRAHSDRDELRKKIDELRKRYHDQLEANAVVGGSITLTIPLIAWLIVHLVRRGAKRFEYDMLGELGEAASDRKRRLRTLARTVAAALAVLIWVLAAVYIFAQLGLDITPLVASASVVGLAVAFGAQALIKDFFYGFFILLENQFTVGDVVKLGTIAGTVEKISLRITILRDLKGVVHYIPNGSIGQVSNMTQGWARVVFEVSVPYSEDADRASDVLREVLDEFHGDSEWSGRILEPPVVAGIQNLTERSIDIRLMIKVRPGRQWEVAREARRRIKLGLDRAGIEGPYPHRLIHHVYEGEGEGNGEGDDGARSSAEG